MKQRMDSRPRYMLAMSRPSWAHSPSPSQTHLVPLGHKEVKFPGEVHPRVPRPSVAMSRWRRQSKGGDGSEKEQIKFLTEHLSSSGPNPQNIVSLGRCSFQTY